MAVFVVAAVAVVTLILVTGDGGPSPAYPVWDPSSRNTAWIEEMRVNPLPETFAPEAAVYDGYWDPYTLEWVAFDSGVEASYPVWDPISRNTEWIP
jgi:hypothetical protein